MITLACLLEVGPIGPDLSASFYTSRFQDKYFVLLLTVYVYYTQDLQHLFWMGGRVEGWVDRGLGREPHFTTFLLIP